MIDESKINKDTWLKMIDINTNQFVYISKYKWLDGRKIFRAYTLDDKSYDAHRDILMDIADWRENKINEILND